MMKTFDRTARVAAVALMFVPLGITPAHARSDGTVLQLAQGPGPGGAPPARGAGGPQSPGGAKAPAGNAAGNSQTDREIANLKKQLKITPQQEPQFNAFAEIMRSNAQEMDAQMSQGSPNQNPNAVEALKREQQLTETQAAGLKRLGAALASLDHNAVDPPEKDRRQGDRRRRRARPGPAARPRARLSGAQQTGAFGGRG